ncbi:MAG: type II toxin-antitoxin system ParD family antitoxin [Alphaproteobacteria bacterium]|nr:type II toxin-antitoxin system ParD family antitoxin [Alphaproteobacteria bacterium]MBV9694966.1 type II toxin-antitoxin system ParD family antitoxin [Alphaproteobacteria bacterium]
MNVSLTPKLEKLVQEKVDSGLYNNASEVIREALRLLQESEELRRAKLKRLKLALATGEADVASGRVTVLKDDEDLDALFARL